MVRGEGWQGSLVRGGGEGVAGQLGEGWQEWRWQAQLGCVAGATEVHSQSHGLPSLL